MPQHSHGAPSLIEKIRTVQVQAGSEPYDAIVIGSGMSGGWAAKELTEKGLKTLVLERGRNVEHGADYITEHRAPWETPFRGRGDRRHAEERQFRQSKAGPYNENTAHWYVDDVDHPYETGEDGADDEFLWVRGYHLGGRSLMWGRQTYRLSEMDFTANERDETWVGDVTAIWTAQGWLFLAVLLDLFSRRVVGWATSASNDRFLALAALRDGLAKRQPEPGLVHHTDRGTPYASGDYRDELDRFGIVPSMSRKGDCWDNAVAESFFSTTKTEAIGDRIPADHNEATRLLAEYIDGFYNTVRRHSFLDYRSPIEFELHSASVLAAA